MTLPDNPLGLKSFEELVNWTVSYLHFKQALEVIGFTPEIAQAYLNAFSELRFGVYNGGWMNIHLSICA